MRIISSLMVPGCLAVMLISCESTGSRVESGTAMMQSEIAVMPPEDPKPVFEQTGRMSYYSVKTNGGRHTASGEKFSDDSATAAHRSLPFGTMVKVTNLANNRSEIVKINNRGPYKKGRVIDVSIGTAKKLNFINSGVVDCKVEVYEDKNDPELLARVTNLSPQVPGAITPATIRPLTPPSLLDEDPSVMLASLPDVGSPTAESVVQPALHSLMQEDPSKVRKVEMVHLPDASNTPEATTASLLIDDGSF